MKNDIEKIIKENPKTYAKIIKNNKNLYNWVLTNSIAAGDYFPSHLFSAINNESNICKRGNQKKFVSISKGYRFCGPANSCDCAKKSVSEKISKTKADQSKKQKEITNNRRKETNLKKYGVENIGQSEHARNNHKKTYQNKETVELINKKIKNTKLKNHNNPNYSNQTKREQTNLEKYGFENPMKNPLIAQKSSETKKENWDPTNLYQKNYEKFLQLLVNEYSVTTTLKKEEYTGVASRPLITFLCTNCSHQFEKRFDYASPPICKVCYPNTSKYQSNEELEIFDFVKSIYNGIIIQNNRSIINPYELDIVLPEKRIAVEYCGLYWHSELSGNKNWHYHKTKYDFCKKKGYRLITVFSDEWINKKEICKSKITSILTDNIRKIGARKTTIAVIDYKKSKEFHNQHHIQGSPKKLGINVGLLFQNELVALGSFVKNNENYELVRFSSKYRIIGGAGKIIKYFEKTYFPSAIISFSDNRWSQGDMYEKLGFQESGMVPPMQSYVENYQHRHHKLKFSKKYNFDTNKTEWQNMQDQGYDRIWDCGKIKWIKYS